MTTSTRDRSPNITLRLFCPPTLLAVFMSVINVHPFTYDNTHQGEPRALPLDPTPRLGGAPFVSQMDNMNHRPVVALFVSQKGKGTVGGILPPRHPLTPPSVGVRVLHDTAQCVCVLG